MTLRLPEQASEHTEYYILVPVILLPVYIPQVFEIKDPIIAFCFNAIMGFFYIFL